MADLVLVVILLALTGSSRATWCVCKDGSDTVLQKSLDYACGAGADCNPIRQNGPCFQPNTVRAHCNYAVNSYFQRKGQSPQACEFSGTATITTSDPSSSGCAYPSSASTSGTSSTPVTNAPSTTTPSTGTPSTTTPSTGTPSTTTPSTGTPSTTTPSTGSPSTTTPSTGTPSTTTGATTPSTSTTNPTTATPYSTTPGVLGGIGNGIGPSGAGVNSDDSHGGLRLVDSGLFSSFSILFNSGLLMLWWG